MPLLRITRQRGIGIRNINGVMGGAPGRAQYCESLLGAQARMREAHGFPSEERRRQAQPEAA